METQKLHELEPAENSKKERIMAIQLVMPFEWESVAIEEPHSLERTSTDKETNTKF